jgi:hypothetical protein
VSSIRVMGSVPSSRMLGKPGSLALAGDVAAND